MLGEGCVAIVSMVVFDVIGAESGRSVAFPLPGWPWLSDAARNVKSESG